MDKIDEMLRKSYTLYWNRQHDFATEFVFMTKNIKNIRESIADWLESEMKKHNFWKTRYQNDYKKK